MQQLAHHYETRSASHRLGAKLLVAGTGTSGCKVCLLGLDRAVQPRKTFARAPKFSISLGESVLRSCEFGLGCLDYGSKPRPLRMVNRSVQILNSRRD
jgi:hypothetical protein